MVRKHQSACCALCQMTAENDDSLEELQNMVNKIKQDAKETWHFTNRDSGERAIFTITTFAEQELESKLKVLGFKPVAKFDRRNGYPPTGKLFMWFLNF